MMQFQTTRYQTIILGLPVDLTCKVVKFIQLIRIGHDHQMFKYVLFCLSYLVYIKMNYKVTKLLIVFNENSILQKNVYAT